MNFVNKNLFFLLLMCLFVIFTNPGITANEYRTALVIGNSTYTYSSLKNPVHDAQDIADTLQKLNFEVHLHKNLTKIAMDEAITKFRKALQKGGIGLFYFAGHGIQVRGQNYLIPTGNPIQNEDEVELRAIPLSQVMNAMAEARKNLNIIILDACRNNPLSKRHDSGQMGLTEPRSAPEDTLIAFATAPGRIAEDGDERNGVFTKHLLSNLEKPGLSLAKIFQNTNLAVRAETTGRRWQQIPWYTSSIGRDFFFLPGSGQPAMNQEIKFSLIEPLVTSRQRELPVITHDESEHLGIMVLFEEQNMVNPIQQIGFDFNSTETVLIRELQQHNDRLYFIDRKQSDVNFQKEAAHSAIEGDAKSAQIIGSLYGADYIITGRSYANTKLVDEAGVKIKTAQSLVTASVIHVRTAEIITADSSTGHYAPVVDENVDNSRAIEKATKNWLNALASKLPTSSGQTIKVTIRKVADYKNLKLLEELLNNTQGVKHVQEVNFQTQIALYRVRGDIRPQTLAQSIDGAQIEGHTLRISSVGNGSLVLRLE